MKYHIQLYKNVDFIYLRHRHYIRPTVIFIHDHFRAVNVEIIHKTPEIELLSSAVIIAERHFTISFNDHRGTFNIII